MTTFRRLVLIISMILVMPWMVSASAVDNIWMPIGDQGRAPSSLQGVMGIAAGGLHTVALKRDGTVVAWGDLEYGAVTVPSGLDHVMAIAAGNSHTVALKKDGTVVAWGLDFGQVTVPDGMSGVTAVSAGYFHTVALKNDGMVMAWGFDSAGQIAVPFGLVDVAAIAAGGYHTVARKSDGTLVAWGDNTYGQTQIPSGLGSIIAIAAGDYHTVALKNDGTVLAWGNNLQGQTDIPSGLNGVVAIAAGGSHSVALKNDGTVVAWGYGGYGATTIPIGLTGVTAIAAGDSHTVVLKTDGTVLAWGNSASGQTTVPPSGRDDITNVSLSYPHTVALKSDGTVVAWGGNGQGQTLVPNDLNQITATAAGGFFTLALKRDGTVVAWGNNEYGETTVPAGLSDVAAIAAGAYHSVALKSDGTLRIWGNNAYGQAGIPSDLNGVTAIAAGDFHTVALKSDGTVVTWGRNDAGQSTTPVGVGGVIAIAAGQSHTVALRSNGTVAAWGANEYGQRRVPYGLNGVIAIAAGWSHTVALKSDGTVVSWGKNEFSQRVIPMGLSGITAIAAGGCQTWLQVATRPANPVIISSATVDYDGTQQILAITTANDRTPTTTTYNGSYTPPTLPGTYEVIAEADYMDSYGLASGTLTIAKIAQTIALTHIDDQIYGVAPIVLNASASSHLPIVFSVVSGPASISDSMLIMTGAGSVVIAADQPGDGVYQAADRITQTITIGQASQIIDFKLIDGQTMGASPVSLQATASSGLPVTFAVISGHATIQGTLLHLEGAGNVVVMANQAGNVDYIAAPAVSQMFTIAKGHQTINGFADFGAHTYGDTPFTIIGGDPDQSLVFTSDNPGVATVSGATVTITGAGTTTITAIVPENDNYLAAPAISKDLVITPAALEVIAADANRLFGATNPPFTGSMTGLVTGDIITVTYSSAADVTTPAGIYGPTTSEAIKPTLVDASGRLTNYTVTSTNGTLTIMSTGSDAGNNQSEGIGGVCGMGGELASLIFTILLTLR